MNAALAWEERRKEVKKIMHFSLIAALVTFSDGDDNTRVA